MQKLRRYQDQLAIFGNIRFNMILFLYCSLKDLQRDKFSTPTLQLLNPKQKNITLPNLLVFPKQT